MRRIGIDIDGVMYHWEKTARYMLREILPNSPYTPDGPLGQVSTGWDYIENNVAPEHWAWLWTEGVRLGLFRHGHLFSGTIEAIRELSKIAEVVVITHRPKSAVNDTLAWLTYQQFPLSGVHLLTGGEPKSSVNPQCDMYVDDKPENCKDLFYNTSATVVALRDQPWNHHAGIIMPYAVRMHTWDGIVRLAQRVFK